jgi:hypothetical protein
MDDPDYLMINPLQIELILSDNLNQTTNNNTTNNNTTNTTNNNKREITEIEERFYNKMEELKNINIQNRRLMYMIQNINHRIILTDV